MLPRIFLLIVLVVSLWHVSAPEIVLAQNSIVSDSAYSDQGAFSPSRLDDIRTLGMQAVIAMWVFVLGTCFGSFLNVVIYRMPAGMSLGKPKSRCPRCETPLAAKDNVPVFGWLMLRGRCRYCSLPIAGRYPIIEATCGVVFLTLLYVELLTGASNVPFRHPDHFHVPRGFWLVWFAKWDLLGMYLLHCSLLIIVLATAMIGYDGHRVQKKLSAFGILLAITVGSMWGELRPIAAYPWPNALQQFSWSFSWTDPILNPGGDYRMGFSLIGFLDGSVGLLLGLLCGFFITWQMSNRQSFVVSPGDPDFSDTNPEPAADPVMSSIAAATLLVGVFLGWQACASVTFLALPFLAAIKLVTAAKTDHGVYRMSGPGFFLLLFGFVLTWKQLDDAVWMIGFRGWDFLAYDWRAEWCVTLVAMFVFSSLVRFSPIGTKTK